MVTMLNKTVPLQIARFLNDQKATDVTLIDISKQSGFADYFVIATVSSFGQLRGLLKNLDDELATAGVHTKGTKRSLTEDEQWILVDCADFIVHLMTKPARDFYALEKLWFESPHLDIATGEALPSV